MKTAYPLAELLRTGKINTDFEVSDQYVTGICLLYPERSGQEHEYMVREKSLVLLDQEALSECVQRAKDLAYQAAVSRLTGVAAPQEALELEVTSPQLQVERRPTAPTAQKPVEPSWEKEVLGGEEAEPDVSPEMEEVDSTLGKPEEKPSDSIASQIGFADLRPASSLLRKEEERPAQEVSETGDEEISLENARNTPITILGKAHLCNGWTAGKILDEHPEIIVDFAHRYSGPKADQKQALEALYPEALRRLHKAA